MPWPSRLPSSCHRVCLWVQLGKFRHLNPTAARREVPAALRTACLERSAIRLTKWWGSFAHAVQGPRCHKGDVDDLGSAGHLSHGKYPSPHISHCSNSHHSTRHGAPRRRGWLPKTSGLTGESSASVASIRARCKMQGKCLDCLVVTNPVLPVKLGKVSSRQIPVMSDMKCLPCEKRLDSDAFLQGGVGCQD